MIHEKINSMIMDAMKSKDIVASQVCKLIKAEMLKTEKEKGFSGWTDASELKLLMKMAAQRSDSILQYKSGNRLDLAEEEQKELDYLNTIIPKQPTDDEISSYTQDVINSMTESGEEISMKIMKTILTKVQEKYPTANGKVISQVVKSNIKS